MRFCKPTCRSRAPSFSIMSISSKLRRPFRDNNNELGHVFSGIARDSKKGKRVGEALCQHAVFSVFGFTNDVGKTLTSGSVCRHGGPDRTMFCMRPFKKWCRRRSSLISPGSILLRHLSLRMNRTLSQNIFFAWIGHRRRRVDKESTWTARDQGRFMMIHCAFPHLSIMVLDALASARVQRFFPKTRSSAALITLWRPC